MTIWLQGHKASRCVPSVVPRWRTSSSKTSFPKSPITFQNTATSRGPNAQTQEPMGHISQLNHNSHGALRRGFFQYLRSCFIHDSLCCTQEPKTHKKNKWSSKFLSLMLCLSPLSPKDTVLVLTSNPENTEACMSETCCLCVWQSHEIHFAAGPSVSILLWSTGHCEKAV